MCVRGRLSCFCPRSANCGHLAVVVDALLGHLGCGRGFCCIYLPRSNKSRGRGSGVEHSHAAELALTSLLLCPLLEVTMAPHGERTRQRHRYGHDLRRVLVG